MEVRRVAAGLMLAGFAFAFVTLRVAGVDVLIDAVGFVLVFNGLRPLQKLGPFFPGAFLAVAVAVPSALQLFLKGGGFAAATGARMALELVLYAVLARGFYGMPALKAHKVDRCIAAGVCAANAVATALWAVIYLADVRGADVVADWILFGAHMALLAVLLRQVLLRADAVKSG